MTGETWECHVDDSAESRKYMTTIRDVLPALGSNSILSQSVIEVGNERFEVRTAPMVNLVTYV